MRPDVTTAYCANENLFSQLYEESLKPRLPAEGSLADRVLKHTTGVQPFLQTVSSELCDNGRVTQESGRRSLSFMARSAATGVVITGTTSLAALGVVIGSPVAAVGLGVAGLVALPPIAERAAFGLVSWAGEALDRFKHSLYDCER
jgi:hypothetical protein